MIKINFVGDILLGELFASFGVGVKTKIEHGIDPFEHITNQLRNAEFTVGNLECVLSNITNQNGIFEHVMRGKPEYVDLLKNNIQIVNLANNHTLDHGEEALLKMKKNLKENNIYYFGHPKNIDVTPLILEKDEIKIGFLGFNLSNKSYKELNETKTEILKAIRKCKDSVNILVLSIHWGLEYVEYPVEWQVSFAKDFFNNGADIIHGHHSHRIQGHVFENGKLIMFSLGNFIFDDRRKQNRYTGIIEVTIGEKKIKSIRTIPLFLNKGFQPDYIDSIRIRKKYDKLNMIAKDSYSSDISNLQKITKEAIRKSYNYHYYNRIYILYNLVFRFYKYFPHFHLLIKAYINKIGK